ncbi:MAG: SAM-dependent methyltransferase, partial [Bilophila sp.]
CPLLVQLRIAFPGRGRIPPAARGNPSPDLGHLPRDKAEREGQVAANADAIITELRAGRDCAFATLGDAMTYSTFGYVLRRIQKAIPNLEVEIVPGITSFATLAAKAGAVLAEKPANSCG